MSITLTQAQTIITAGLAAAREKKFQPLAIVVLDARGVLKAYAAEDGTSLRRARSPPARRMARWHLGSARARWASARRSGRISSPRRRTR